MKRSLLYLVCSLGAWSVQAQTTRLDKEAAFSAALDKNFGIQVSRNQLNIAKNNYTVYNQFSTLTEGNDDTIDNFRGGEGNDETTGHILIRLLMS